MVGELLLDTDFIFMYLGEDFFGTIPEEEIEPLTKAIQQVAGSCLRAAAKKYVGTESHKTFQAWANMTAIEAHKAGNLS